MGGQTAPTPYQPPNQAGAAAGFQTGTNQLAQAGTSLYNSVAPQLSQITSNVENNPYYGQAMTGAQNAANTATSTVAPGMLAGASQDAGIANMAALSAPQYANAATTGGANAYNYTNSMLPMATSGAGYAAPALGALAGAGAQAYGQNQQGIANLGTTGLSAANQILQTGFDPQNALYNQQYSQSQAQQNALNAMNGVAGSPYAAGVSGQTGNNFNIDWQNAQLARQVQALGAYDSAASTYAGDLSNLTSTGMNNLATGINSGVSDYNALVGGAVNNATNLINTGTGALNSGINTAVGAQTGLGNLAIAGNAGSAQLGTDALNTMAGAAQLPSDLYLQQQQAALAALGSQISGTNAALAPTQQSVADYGNYLNIGQTASQGAIQAAQVNNQQSNAMAAGFGNLFGNALGMFAFA